MIARLTSKPPRPTNPALYYWLSAKGNISQFDPGRVDRVDGEQEYDVAQRHIDGIRACHHRLRTGLGEVDIETPGREPQRGGRRAIQDANQIRDVIFYERGVTLLDVNIE